MKLTIGELEKAVGGLSTPSKMPGFAIGLPAWKCKLGAILRKKEGSVCHECYALKGMYVFPTVKAAQMRRLKAIESPDWVANMIALLRAKYRNKKGNDRVFRFHDSGDVQHIQHLRKIALIAIYLPTIRFWLPSREATIIQEYIDIHGPFPNNLSVRLSAPMVGQRPSKKIPGVNTSTVNSGIGYACPARNQGNNCGDCRSCWNRSVKNVDYPLH